MHVLSFILKRIPTCKHLSSIYAVKQNQQSGFLQCLEYKAYGKHCANMLHTHIQHQILCRLFQLQIVAACCD